MAEEEWNEMLLSSKRSAQCFGILQFKPHHFKGKRITIQILTRSKAEMHVQLSKDCSPHPALPTGPTRHLVPWFPSCSVQSEHQGLGGPHSTDHLTPTRVAIRMELHEALQWWGGGCLVKCPHPSRKGHDRDRMHDPPSPPHARPGPGASQAAGRELSTHTTTEEIWGGLI